MKYSSKLATIFLSFVLFISFLPKTDVQAYDTNSSYFYGYKTFQRFDFCGTSGKYHRVLCDGVDTQVKDKNGNFSKSLFINYIKGLLGAVDNVEPVKGYNKRLGASFIIHTMIGAPQPDKSSIPTPEEIADWEGRIGTDDINDTSGITIVSDSSYQHTINSTFEESSTGSGNYIDYDDRFYKDKSTADSWLFKKDGKVVYALKKECANPVGSIPLPGLPKRSEWTISAASSADKTSAKPGDYIYWTHTLKNDGPNNGTGSVFSHLKTTNMGNWDSDSSLDGASVPAGNANATIRTVANDLYTNYKVKKSDIGQTLCQSIVFQSDINGKDKAPNPSTPSCVTIDYKYALTPTVTINPAGVIEDGTSFTVDASIDNSGGTVSQPAAWNLMETITNVSQGSGANIVFEGNSNNSVKKLTITASGEAGKHYCYVLSITPHSSDDPGKISSVQVCVTIGKKPKVQIWGGDLWAVGKIQTSQSLKSNNTFGSWDEYGIFSASAVDGMASGSAFAGTGLAGVSSSCAYSYLSFTNVPTGLTSCTGAVGTIGNYAGLRTASDVASSFPGGTTLVAAPPTIPGNLGAGTYTIFGNLTLNASTLPTGKSIIIKSTGTVTINGNQTYYSGPYTNAIQLPQLVIIADNINIADNVTNVDAWLVAKTSINTCSLVATSAPLTSNMCNQQLIVNGPVMTGKLYLRRTAGSGSGAASGDPAEIFNLRPDAYLWAAARAQSTGRVQKVYVTELPPRF